MYFSFSNPIQFETEQSLKCKSPKYPCVHTDTCEIKVSRRKDGLHVIVSDVPTDGCSPYVLRSGVNAIELSVFIFDIINGSFTRRRRCNVAVVSVYAEVLFTLLST
ncbi:hypothetical protein Trydic_g16910 [Trypoxylus dichotomus]